MTTRIYVVGDDTQQEVYDTDIALLICSIAANQPFSMDQLASLCIWMVPGTWVEYVED